jgi:hypothetical protein
VEVRVKHRILGDGRIWIDRVRTKVLRDTGGWYQVQSPSRSEDARVLFRPAQDMIVIEQSGEFLKIAFKQGEAAFRWHDRLYRTSNMALGKIRIDEGTRDIAQGVVTTSGIRLTLFRSDFLPIVRALAWGLTLRSEELARDAFRGGGAG